MTRRSGVSRRAWVKEDPEQSRIAEGGRFIMDVYPALALVTFNHTFFGRRKGPKYNPANKRKVRLEDWTAVVETVRQYAQHAGIVAIKEWANEILRIASPRKARPGSARCSYLCPGRLPTANRATR
jgi:predicted RNase H-like nuclease